jgi:hypothetical protein
MAATGQQRRQRWLWAGAVLIAIYLAGVFARHQFGIAVDVHNRGRETIRQVSVKVEYRGKRYPVPDLAPNQSARVYVRPVGESHINVEFAFAGGGLETVRAAGYVESDYCGTASLTLLPGRQVQTRDDTFRLLYWQSWLEFL